RTNSSRRMPRHASRSRALRRTGTHDTPAVTGSPSVLHCATTGRAAAQPQWAQRRAPSRRSASAGDAEFRVTELALDDVDSVVVGGQGGGTRPKRSVRGVGRPSEPPESPRPTGTARTGGAA